MAGDDEQNPTTRSALAVPTLRLKPHSICTNHAIVQHAHDDVIVRFSNTKFPIHSSSFIISNMHIILFYQSRELLHSYHACVGDRMEKHECVAHNHLPHTIPSFPQNKTMIGYATYTQAHHRDSPQSAVFPSSMLHFTPRSSRESHAAPRSNAMLRVQP